VDSEAREHVARIETKEAGTETIGLTEVGVFACYFVAFRFLFCDVHGLLEDAYIPTILFMAGITVASSGFYMRWLFWRKESRQLPPTSALLGTALAVIGLVVAFTVVSSFLVEQGWVHAAGWTHGLPKKWHLVNGIERDFYWSFLDAIPGLAIPTTLHWKHPAHELTGYSGGAIVLAFKVLVILPVIGLALILIRHAQAADGTSAGAGEVS
jgi:hypothetical protein